MFCIPLLAQGHLEVLERFLEISQSSAMAIMLFLDSLINRRIAVQAYREVIYLYQRHLRSLCTFPQFFRNIFLLEILNNNKSSIRRFFNCMVNVIDLKIIFFVGGGGGRRKLNFHQPLGFYKIFGSDQFFVLMFIGYKKSNRRTNIIFILKKTNISSLFLPKSRPLV